MKITFDKADREHVIQRLKDYGISVSEQRVNDVLHNVEATFASDAFREEVDYMIENFEADQ